MAYGVTLSASMAYTDSEGSEEARSLSDLLATVATKKFIRHKQNIGTAEEAVQLAEVTAPGWAIFVNLDPTNYIELRVGTGGAKFAKLKPGEFALLRLGSGAQVPYAISDTAACQMEVFIAST
jgi:hypothetical protein